MSPSVISGHIYRTIGASPSSCAGSCLCDHLSKPTRYRGARAAYPELKGDEQSPVHKWTSLLLGLAPSGGYLAAGITVGAGGLLHHLFTLA